MEEKVILIDGNNLALANHHAHIELRTSDGHLSGLLHGMFVSLLTIRKHFPTAALWVVWDGAGKNWRHRVSEGRYKANRQHSDTPEPEVLEKREGIAVQMDAARAILDALHVPQIRCASVEADDLLGILATAATKRFKRVIIRSTDRDFFQLVSRQIRVWRNPIRDDPEIIGPSFIRSTYGFTGKYRWLVFRAVNGDASDGLAGLAKGVGEKRALQILEAGLKLPVNTFPKLDSKHLSRLAVSWADWERVNQNFLLMAIAETMDDPNLPPAARPEIRGFMFRHIQKKLRRTPGEVDVWKAARLLGQFELAELTDELDALMRL